MAVSIEKKVFESRRRIRQAAMSAAFLVVLAEGWFWPVLGYFIPLCMALGVGIAFFRGRKWCDWYCPRGSFFDALVKRVSPQKDIPRYLKGRPVRIGILSFLMLLLSVQLVRLWPDFMAIGGFFVMLLTITTTVGLVLALVLHQRAWCYICPIGTLQKMVGGDRYPLSIDAARCNDCALCGKVCPVQIRPYRFKGKGVTPVGDADCLKCATCTTSCPRHALKLGDRLLAA